MRKYRVVYRAKDGVDGLGYVWSDLDGALQDAAKLAQDPTIAWVGIKVSDDPHALYLYPEDMGKLKEVEA